MMLFLRWRACGDARVSIVRCGVEIIGKRKRMDLPVSGCAGIDEVGERLGRGKSGKGQDGRHNWPISAHFSSGVWELLDLR